MKQDGFKIISECIDDDALDVEGQSGWEKVSVIKRPISTLDKETIKGAEKTAEEYHAKVTPDPDPLKMKSDKTKGLPAGDPLEKTSKDKSKEV